MELLLKLMRLELNILHSELKMALASSDLIRVEELNENLLRLADMDEDYLEYLKITHIENLDITEEQFISDDY